MSPARQSWSMPRWVRAGGRAGGWAGGRAGRSMGSLLASLEAACTVVLCTAGSPAAVLPRIRFKFLCSASARHPTHPQALPCPDLPCAACSWRGSRRR
jgi:hypothetical protein